MTASPSTYTATSERATYDAAIAGGGLAGLCLALQLKRASPEMRVAVIDRASHPLPSAAHKVGESSVEIGSCYLGSVLGLEEELAKEVPKLGLRFFFSRGDNSEIRRRFELGPSRFLPVKSFQIDRGRFETALGHRCRELGIDFLDGRRVTGIDLGSNGTPHELVLEGNHHPSTIRCTWLVDASGRASLLKRKLGLSASNGHHVSASWFRLDEIVDAGDWCAEPQWSQRVTQPRRLSTVHLMDEGYWVWLIPLAEGRTSVGIVVDDRLHAHSEIRTLERAMNWLERHEPQLATAVEPHLDKVMDFRVLRDFSFSAKRVFSNDRWCLTGDAGLFLDPLYSPGTDFIAIANGFITEIILRSVRGEDIRELASTLDATYRRLYRIFLTNYRQQYAIMGNARVMSLKIVWDFAIYWGCVAHLFCHGKLADPSFMRRADSVLSGYAALTVAMQDFFREWSKLDKTSALEGHLDYSRIEVLTDLNAGLLRNLDDAAVLESLEGNLQLAGEMQQEILAMAGSRVAALERKTTVVSNHLEQVFAALGMV